MTPLENENANDHATLEARLRIESLERTVMEIKKIAGESHTDVAAISERIAGITEWQRRQNGDISSMVTALNNLSNSVGEKIDSVKNHITGMQNSHDKEISEMKAEHGKSIAKICDDYDGKIESLAITTLKQQSADRDKVQRWLIGLLGTIIGGIMIAHFTLGF